MSGSIALILVIFYTIASLVVYHKIFTVYYFGSLTNNLFKELFGAFLVGIILTGLTLYFWWLAAIIIVLAGVGFAGKTDNPQGKKVIMGAFVVFAIIVAIVGIGFKRQVKQKQEEKNNAESYNSSSADEYDGGYTEDNNSADSYAEDEANYVSDETDYYEETSDLNMNAQTEYVDEDDTINADIVDNDELMDSIMVYYAMYYGTNNVAAEVDHETEETVAIRLYDPSTNATSNTLGFYEYSKNTGVWTDTTTGEILDFNEAADVYNESLEVDNSSEETISEYYVYVNAPDGYVNLRTGPGTEYDIICPIQNGEALELYEEATAKNGKKWAKVAYWEDGGWNTGYVIASQLNY